MLEPRVVFVVSTTEGVKSQLSVNRTEGAGVIVSWQLNVRFAGTVASTTTGATISWTVIIWVTVGDSWPEASVANQVLVIS